MGLSPRPAAALRGSGVSRTANASRNEITTSSQDEAAPSGQHQPWRTREDWAQGRVESTGRGWIVVGAWIFALVWMLISSPILFLLRPQIERGNRAAAIGLVFPAAGLLLLASAIRRTLLWRKFGVSTLVLRTTPIVPGERLLGAIRTRLMPQPAGGYRLRLTCVRRTATGSGQDRTSHETIAWREERRMDRALQGHDPGGTEIPVSFAIPADAQATTVGDPDDRILWVLDADAAVPGLDYRAEFEVPVFGAPKSAAGSAEAGEPFSAATGSSEDPMLEYEAPEEPFRPDGDRGLRVGAGSGGGAEFFLGPLRNPGASIGLLTFLALWSCAVVFLVRAHAPLIFPIVFGGFELLLIVFALDLTLGTTRLVIEAGEARLTRGFLGIGPTRVFRCADLKDVRLTIGMQSGERNGTPYYTLSLVDRFDASFSAGRYIRDKREAEWLAAEMKRRIASGA